MAMQVPKNDLESGKSENAIKWENKY